MAKLWLYLTYEPENGTPVSLTRTDRRELLLKGAVSAIKEAEEVADIATAEDEDLGFMRREEAHRLRRTLERLLPELVEYKLVN